MRVRAHVTLHIERINIQLVLHYYIIPRPRALDGASYLRKDGLQRQPRRITFALAREYHRSIFLHLFCMCFRLTREAQWEEK